MFDIWRKIDEKGAVAVPVKASALSALGWAEVGEKYPELIPEAFRRYDVYSDPQLIRESPFAPIVIKGAKSFHFKVTDPIGGKILDTWVDPMGLVETFGRGYFHADDEISSFGGILVCSCGKLVVPEYGVRRSMCPRRWFIGRWFVMTMSSSSFLSVKHTKRVC